MTKYQVVLPKQAADYIKRYAAERGISQAAVLRLGLGLVHASDEAQKRGQYVGATHDRDALATVFVGPV